MNGHKLCLIDDDHIFRFTFSRTLRSLDPNQDLLMFADGAEAIEYFQANCHTPEVIPDIIFLDINMPIMDGWQFLDEYTLLKNKLNKRIRINMLSSSVDQADIDLAKSHPEIAEYIVKPFSPDGLKSLFTMI